MIGHGKDGLSAPISFLIIRKQKLDKNLYVCMEIPGGNGGSGDKTD
jgi:hypothetical protein